MSAYRWLIEDRKMAPGRIALAGDSAGGGLVVAALLAIRDANLPLPAAGVCISPWTDMTCSAPSYQSKAASDPIVMLANITEMAKAYLGAADARTPLASPLFANLRGLPRSSSRSAPRRCCWTTPRCSRIAPGSAGVDVTYEAWQDMIHVWHWFLPWLDEAEAGVDRSEASSALTSRSRMGKQAHLLRWRPRPQGHRETAPRVRPSAPPCIWTILTILQALRGPGRQDGAFLDEERVRAALRWDDLIDAMESALAELSSGRVIQPVRNMMVIEENRRYLGIMPAASAEAMGLKLVGFYPVNAGTGVPTHMAMILLFRPDTGEPLAVMDGRLITEMRTAAVSAAVTRRLAPPHSPVLALLGSGVQAAAHVEALSRVRRFSEVRVWSRTPAHAERFARAHGATAMDAAPAVRGADVVVDRHQLPRAGPRGRVAQARRPGERGGRASPDLARARRRCHGQRADRRLTRGGARGVGRRDPGTRPDPRRGRRDLRRPPPPTRAGHDNHLQVGRARGGRHRRRATGAERLPLPLRERAG